MLRVQLVCIGKEQQNICLHWYREYLFVQVCTVIRVVSWNVVVSLKFCTVITCSNSKKQELQYNVFQNLAHVPGHQSPEKETTSLRR